MISSLQSSRSQQGFTLIELVVVIVILGILAVTAAPKFIDLTVDARKGVLDGAKAAVISARDIGFAQSLITSGGTGTYPSATATGIGDRLQLEGFAAQIPTTDAIIFGLTDATDGTKCGVKYDTSSAIPTVTVVEDDCS
jgi:MSHA pilin protein MshA